MLALEARTSGTVYLAVLVDRKGKVEDVVAQQVDLRAIGTKHEMDVLRKNLAEASIGAVRKWTFNLPQSGPEAGANHWTVTIPVNFNLVGWGEKPHEREYGKWDSYIPGPVTPIPWKQDQVASGNNADATPDGPVFMPDKRFVLLTPLSPG
ncbi:MAG: hypothetical protein ACREPP_03500 [Rhodanobacteraceae bacterium]